ncbi:hypothetical protein M3Y98_00621000 [Aphelenchoides besseyi]|nr:hypothetical protein M3Y98_00621000 [Aphelenchoides besseyi]
MGDLLRRHPKRWTNTRSDRLIAISVGIFLIQNFAWYLVRAYIVYFLVVRALEKVSVVNLQDKAVLITSNVNMCIRLDGCDSGFGWRLTLKWFKTGAKRLRDETRKIKNGSDLLTNFTLDVQNDVPVDKARKLVESELQDSRGLWSIVNNAQMLESKEFSKKQKKFPNSENLMQTFSLNLRDRESVKRAREFVDERFEKQKAFR